VKNENKKMLLMLFVCVIVVISSFCIVLNTAYVRYEYKRDIESHFDMAKDTTDVDVAITELENGLELLFNSGVSNGSKTLLFFNTAQSNVGYYAGNIEFMILRLVSLRDWYYNQTNNLTLDVIDLYNVKLKNIQNQINDNLPELRHAWFMENHLFCYCTICFAVFFGIFAAIGVLIFGVEIMTCGDF